MSEKQLTEEDLALSESDIDRNMDSTVNAMDETTAGQQVEEFDPFSVAPRIDFDEREALALLIHARAVLESTVCGEPLVAKLDPDIADSPAHGLFVTLVRGVMRACKGQWANAETATVGSILSSVARAAASRDMRLPSITEEELPYMKVDLSFLHDVVILPEDADARLSSIKVGQHGVAIRAGHKKKSVLLPQVAVENNWDAKTFLEQASAAAGISKHGWTDPNIKVRSFRTHVLRDEPTEQEFNPRKLTAKDMAFLIANAVAAIRGGSRQESVRPLLANKFEHELGIQLFAKSGATGFACDKGRSLIDLTRSAARTMVQLAKQKNIVVDELVRLQVLWQPMNLVATDYPARHSTLIHSTIVARGKANWTVVFPKPGQPFDTVAHALSRLGITHSQWQEGGARLTAFGSTGYNLAKPID